MNTIKWDELLAALVKFQDCPDLLQRAIQAVVDEHYEAGYSAGWEARKFAEEGGKSTSD